MLTSRLCYGGTQMNFIKRGLICLLAVVMLTTGLTAFAQDTAAEGNATTSETTQEQTVTNAAITQVPKSKVSHSSIKSSINKYKANNSEVEAWLYIPNTNMNFPIVKPKDNMTYVARSVGGTFYPNNNYKNFKETATYTDYRVNFGSTWESSSKNIVIYGHNWTNLRAPYDIGNHARHTMLGQLPSYNSIDFAKQNPYIYFSTGDLEGVWKVFSVAYIESDTKVFNYNGVNPGSETFSNMLSEYQKRSIFNFNVPVDSSDRIITIDTCTRHYANVGGAQRFVVVARLLRNGETDSDPVSVTVNQNVKRPSFKIAA